MNFNTCSNHNLFIRLHSFLIIFEPPCRTATVHAVPTYLEPGRGCRAFSVALVQGDDGDYVLDVRLQSGQSVKHYVTGDFHRLKTLTYKERSLKKKQKLTLNRKTTVCLTVSASALTCKWTPDHTIGPSPVDGSPPQNHAAL